MVLREGPVPRAVADMLTPSTRRLATWSNALRAQRRPLYAVPVCVLTVPPQTVQRYRQRRPHFVGNEPWPTMLRPQFPTVVTPALGAGHPVDRVHRSRVPGGNPRFSPKISEVKATDQQRPAQAPKYECVYLSEFTTGSEARTGIGGWMDFYNRCRPHSSLNGRTPEEAYTSDEADRSLGLRPTSGQPNAA